ncbi:NAD-dependent epimerase/dehydratase family protein [Devosia sediminis]|uniref:NAD(P)-dependent oxidoreductase n=1 Tax=Devosia sediminis TaxID=2798801 RepID=A0A934IQI9_9HYPH|nr:NAD(P)-dependent oxidoreductase [Devosia sediminis]MBJ3784973.1 NAD(P)-dependent oxidoreductase [Devosia sediminis]
MSRPAVPEVLTAADLPDHFVDVDHLEDFMSVPTQGVIDDLNALDGDLMILGVGGKIGVTMARMAKKAVPHKRVIGVSRFSEEGLEARLNSWGIETIRCDLLDRDAVNALPKVANIIYMAGLKFDYRGREDFLWAMNTIAPQITAEAFRDSRIVSFSTIHVYPWSNPLHGGVTERELPMARPGEYANSVVGRERTFEHFSKKHGTPGRIMRFVYAIDPRYGVMQEVASWVFAGKPVPLATSHANVMWQGDANAQFLRMLGQCEAPATPINVGGPEALSIRYLANRFGEAFGKEPTFANEEAETCLLVNCDKANGIFGNPVVSIDPMIRWVAEWVKSGKPTLGKPSKFEVRSGEF